jgi:hypothetical protein
MKNDLVQAFELMVYCMADQSGTTQPGIQRIHDPKLLVEMLNYCKKQREEAEKYFTPTIEDLHVGYECEVLPINESLGWEAGKLSYETGHEGPGVYNLYPFWYTTRKGKYGRIKTMIHDFKQIRVPYLTQEQIEKEGWTFQTDTWVVSSFRKGKYILYFEPKSKKLRVYDNGYVFDGYCPSINEFRTIMKFLNIQ